MLVSLSTANFRSFNEEETFSLVASSRISGHHEDHATPIPYSAEKVLKAGVIYGANGAGKSNLLKALRLIKSVALEVRKKHSGTGREPFRLSSSVEATSSFDLQLIADDKLYRFGFKIDDLRITEEWLSRIKGDKETVIYERVTDVDGKVKISAPGLKKAGDKVKALVTVGSPQNQSFLATVQANLETEDMGNDLESVLSWFSDTLRLIAPNAAYGTLNQKLSKEEEFLSFAGEFLKSSSTGIDHLEVSKIEISESELESIIPPEVLPKIFENLREKEGHPATIKIGSGNELIVERGEKDHFYRIAVHGAHQTDMGTSALLDLKEESDGTRRLLNLLPALYTLRKHSAVFFIDEIDRSMHPMLVRKFLEFFLHSCSSGNRQIIVTTHESNLLDLDLLRRDEIWFVEKNHHGATKLYSLSDFKVRTDLEIRKHYLQGRFGAVPFLGNLDRLQSDCETFS